jgi:periplasmic protein TonB
MLAESRHYDITVRWALPVAAVVWLAIVWTFGQLLLTPKLQIEALPPIEARIVELPEPAAPPAAKKSPPPAQPPKPKVVHIRKPVPVKPKAPQPKPVAKPVEVTPPKSVPPVAKTEPEKPSPVPVPDTAHHAPPGAVLGARAIYQPVPKIPDELRGEALKAVAVARFDIGTDGTVSVELVTPTPDPRINQLILNTLRTWRFFPALKVGKPVRSTQEINIHVDID